MLQGRGNDLLLYSAYVSGPTMQAGPLYMATAENGAVLVTNLISDASDRFM